MALKRPWMVAAGVIGGILGGFLAGSVVVRRQAVDPHTEAVASHDEAEAAVLQQSTGSVGPQVAAGKNGQKKIPTAPTGEPTIKPQPLTTGRSDPRNQPSTIEPLRRGLLQVDREIAEGNVAAAIGTCQSLLDTSNRLLHDRLQARIGICCEAIGQYDEAVEQYRELTSRSATPHIRQFAHVSQARVWFAAGRHQTAIPLLCGFLRMSDAANPNPSRDLVAEARQLLGCALSDLARRDRDSSLLDDTTAIVPPVSRDPARLVAQLDAIPSSKTTAPLESEESSITLRSQFGGGADGAILDVTERGGALPSFLTKLTSAAGFDIIGSRAARAAIAGRTATMSVRDQPLASTLDLVLLPLELHWRESESTIEIQTSRELEPAERTGRLAATASRLLRGTITQSPEHDLAPAALLRLAVLTSDAGDSSQAASFYAQLIREYPRSPLLAWAWFNRGKIELRAGEFEEARKSFFQVIDGSPGHELAAASRLYVGRLFLELGQPEHAVRPLIRATTQAAGEDVQTEAALLLASAYLTTGKPYPASMVLMDYRKPLMREETVDRAAFLSALARFQATTDPAQMNEEGRNLVTAITRIHVGDFFGASMIPLAGAAYRQLQLHGQMAELYRQALPRISSPPIRDQLHRELGEWYRQSGRLSEAADHFRALTDSTTRQTQLHGRRELASIAFDLKLDQDCLRSCRRLLTETGDDAEKLAVLDLMGRVYERRGEYSNAAMCFAGLLPDGTLVDGKKPTERAADSREILRD